jgi:hypothetical protein
MTNRRPLQRPAKPLARYSAMGEARFASGSATARSYTTPWDTIRKVPAHITGTQNIGDLKALDKIVFEEFNIGQCDCFWEVEYLAN